MVEGILVLVFGVLYFTWLSYDMRDRDLDHYFIYKDNKKYKVFFKNNEIVKVKRVRK